MTTVELFVFFFGGLHIAIPALLSLENKQPCHFVISNTS